MAQKRTSSQTAPRKVLTPTDMRNGIRRLQQRIEEVEAFDPQAMKENHPAELSGLETSIKTTLSRIFGDDTYDYKRFITAAELLWSPGIYVFGGNPTPLSDYIDGVKYNKERSLAQLREAVRSLEEDLAEKDELLKTDLDVKSQPYSNNIFLVHGRDEGVKNEVALFLRAIGLEPIILHQRPNSGRHLLTKFQEESEGASFAVVLITPDDEGGLSGGAVQKRARQNVVFELGFFIGKLGPSRVAALVKGEVEKPSDFDGIGYVTLDPGGAWKGLLARELKSARVPFDPAKVFEA